MYPKFAIPLLVLTLLTPGAPCRADQRAETILRQAQALAQSARMIDAKSVQTTTQQGLGMTGYDIVTVQYIKPNKLVETEWDLDHIPSVGENLNKLPHTIVVCDGRWRTSVIPDGTVTRTRQASSHDFTDQNLDMFTLRQPPPKAITLTFRGKERFNGVLCDVVRMKGPETTTVTTTEKTPDKTSTTTSPGDSSLETVDVLVGPDHILREARGSDSDSKFTIDYTRVAYNKPIPANIFRFHTTRDIRAWQAATYAASHRIEMDPRATALLERAQDAMSRLHSLTATETRVFSSSATKKRKARHHCDIATAVMLRPNFLRAEHWYVESKSGNAPTKDLDTLVLSDGSRVSQIWDQVHGYYEAKVAAKSGESPYYFSTLMSGFYSRTNPWLRMDDDPGTKSGWCRYVGRHTWRGKSYQVVHVRRNADVDGEKFSMDTEIFIAPDGLIERTMERAVFPHNVHYTDIVLTNIRLNPPVLKSVFAYKLPAGATEKAQFPFLTSTSKKPLAAQTIAPDFTVAGIDGKPIKLSDYVGKVVVLDFWSTWCGPCQASLPHTEDIAAKHADKAVVVLAVNVWDTQKAFDAWIPAHKQYGHILFAIDTKGQGADVASSLYNVEGIPTQYVIDPTGKIVHSIVGFSGPTTELANAIDSALPKLP